MKVVLLGTAPSSINLAPYGNPEWQIWACSPGTMGVAPRIDKFFELHRYEPGQPWFQPSYCDFLKAFPGEVIMSAPVKEIPNCKIIPKDYLIEKYGPYWFTSSIAWMFAMAIEAGAKTIALYGVDMGATEEYGDQRLGCQYFAQIARAKGIEVGVPPESDLFRPAPLYGVCENSHGWIKQTARERELVQRLEDAKIRKEAAEKESWFLEGALDDLRWQKKSWFGSDELMGMRYVEPPLIEEKPELFLGGYAGPNLSEPYKNGPGPIILVPEEDNEPKPKAQKKPNKSNGKLPA